MVLRKAILTTLVVLVVVGPAWADRAADGPGRSDGDSRSRQLTQTELEGVVDAIVSNDPLTTRQQSIVQDFTDTLRRQLSFAGRETLADLERKIQAAHQPGDTVNWLMATVWDLSDPAVVALENEIEGIVKSLPAGDGYSGGRQRMTDGQEEDITIVIWMWTAVAACDFSAVACMNDVEQAWEECMMGVLCNDRERPSTLCCDKKAQNDLVNCVVTCGANREDGDYDHCCYRP